MLTTESTTAGPRGDEASLDPTASAWLPITAEDVAGPRPTEQPEHGWPGSLFIFLTNLAVIVCALGMIGAVVGVVVAGLGQDAGMAGLALLALGGLWLGYKVQSTLAQHVEHFTRWGWRGAMAELTLATLAKVNVLVTQPDSFVGPLIGIVLDLLWMSYFWDRRADFGIDLDV